MITIRINWTSFKTMDLSTIYPTLKTTHICLVILSLLFFTARGGSRISGGQWHLQNWVKVSPHMLDTLLFSTGIWLMFITSQFPIQQHWLTLKAVLLLVYILCGMSCMKATSIKHQRIYYGLALSFGIGMIAVASNRSILFN